MHCPRCGGETSVTETRDAGRYTLRRRRQCAACKLRFTTFEEIAPPQLRVEKRRGDSEPYDRDKLQRSVERVTKHRPLAEETLDSLVERIEADLAHLKTVRWSTLAERVIDALQNLDARAARKMAANYLDNAGRLRFDEASAGAPEPQLDLFDGDS